MVPEGRDTAVRRHALDVYGHGVHDALNQVTQQVLPPSAPPEPQHRERGEHDDELQPQHVKHRPTGLG
jgi:hypothetical protein